jgi:hypothetical protein
MRRANPAWIGPVSVLVVMLVFLGACSRREGQDTPKPVVFFAPETITNVPDTYKPLYLGNLSADRVEKFRAALPYESISLERTTNSASGPIYRVTFHRSGQAEFDEFQPKKSQATGQIDLPTFARLCYALDSGGFRDFQDKYRANPLENTACMVTVSTGKSPKTVADYGTIGPIQLWTIEQLIDGVRERTDWKLVPKK